MSKTKIEWAQRVWNPVRGCSRVSEGCRNCYAERQAYRFSNEGQPWHGFVNQRFQGKRGWMPSWTGKVELIPDKLSEPLGWRKPARVFVNSMSDLFHESLPDDAIDRVFAVMALAPRHTFQMLTKRPERMRAYMSRGQVMEWTRAQADSWDAARRPHYEAARKAGKLQRAERIGVAGAHPTWPLPNVWLGVSIEDQTTANERIPHLLATPAAKRFVSYEPALGPVDLGYTFTRAYVEVGGRPPLDWVIVGGESGRGARPCDVAWIRSAVEQCKEAGVPCFVKQLGAYSIVDQEGELDLHHPKGGDPAEWPEDLRVREVPQ